MRTQRITRDLQPGTQHGRAQRRRAPASSTFGGKAPGKQSNPAHYHMLEEEHLLILEGQVTLRL